MVGRSHSRSLGFIGKTSHPPYLELSDDPRVLDALDELITTFVYLRVKQEKRQRRRRNGHAHSTGMSPAMQANMGASAAATSGVGMSSSAF